MNIQGGTLLAEELRLFEHKIVHMNNQHFEGAERIIMCLNYMREEDKG